MVFALLKMLAMGTITCPSIVLTHGLGWADHPDLTGSYGDTVLLAASYREGEGCAVLWVIGYDLTPHGSASTTLIQIACSHALTNLGTQTDIGPDDSTSFISHNKVPLWFNYPLYCFLPWFSRTAPVTSFQSFPNLIPQFQLALLLPILLASISQREFMSIGALNISVTLMRVDWLLLPFGLVRLSWSLMVLTKRDGDLQPGFLKE